VEIKENESRALRLKARIRHNATIDRYAGSGRHAEAEEIYAAEEIHTEA
jgi:hypothetical protein